MGPGETVIRQIASLHKQKIHITMVHGGGPSIQKLLETARVESRFIDGHRQTDANAMRYVEMALNGEVNGQLVNLLQRHGLNAVGLSGKDGAMVRVQKRRPANAENDLGFVGDIEKVDIKLLRLLENNGFLPVVAPVALGPDEESYNVNADLFAAHVAAALKTETFLLLTNVNGIYRDMADPRSHIKEIDAAELAAKPAWIQSGMMPKVEACLTALQHGVARVVIASAEAKDVVIRAAAGENVGTLIKGNL